MTTGQAAVCEPANSEIKAGPALAYMFAAVIAFSLIPLAIKLTGAERAPFLFAASWQMGVVVGCLLVLTMFYRRLFHVSNLAKVKTYLFPSERGLNARRVLVWSAVIVNFEYALLAWSVQFIDISVSVVLFGLWPVLLALLRLRSNGASARNGQDGKHTSDFPMRTVIESVSLAIVSLSGLVFVISAQLGGFTKFGDAIPLWLVIGVALAAGAMMLSALKEAGIRGGWELGNRPTANGYEEGSPPVFCFVVIGVLVGSLGSAVVCAAVGLGRGEILAPMPLGIAFIAGTTIGTTAEVARRKVKSLEDEARRDSLRNETSCDSLGCTILVFSLIWLLASTQAGVQRVDYLLLGAVFIITANLLVSTQRIEVRRGFRALVIALGLSGTFVYLRDVIFTETGITHWILDSSAYFGSVGLSATVFTLLFAFRMARMYTRDREEASLTFAVSRRLGALVQRNVVSGNVLDSIQRIDGSRDRNSLDETKYRDTLRQAYGEVRDYIDKAQPEDGSDRDMLVQTESELDALVRSKQGGQELGEISAIVVFATLTICVTLATRPDDLRCWTLLLVELFSALMSSVVIFLVEFIVGWGRDRNRKKLRYDESGETAPSVAFPEDEPQQVDRWLFIMMAVAILAAYVGLLGYKALGQHC